MPEAVEKKHLCDLAACQLERVGLKENQVCARSKYYYLTVFVCKGLGWSLLRLRLQRCDSRCQLHWTWEARKESHGQKESRSVCMLLSI